MNRRRHRLGAYDMPHIKMVDPMQNMFNYKGIFWQTIFESLDGFEKSTGVTCGVSNVVLLTDASIGDKQYILKEMFPKEMVVPMEWSKKRRFKAGVYFDVLTGYTAHVMQGIEGTSNHFGFKIIDGVIYGSCADETTEALTPALYTLPHQAIFMVLEAVLTPNKKVDFYITPEDGKRAYYGSLNTNLPQGTTSSGALLWVSITTNENVAKELKISQFMFLQEP